MSDSNQSNSKPQATVSGVTEMIARLGTDNEAEILHLACTERINNFDLLAAPLADGMPDDTVDESELIEASPLPLTRAQRAVLIRSSVVSGVKKADREG